MLKRNLAVVLVASVVLGVAAFAWAEGGPSRPRLATATVTGPDRALGRRPCGPRGPGRGAMGGPGALHRAIHGDLVVPAQPGFQNVRDVAIAVFQPRRAAADGDGGTRGPCAGNTRRGAGVHMGADQTPAV